MSLKSPKPPRSEAELRQEFWSLPPEALVDRETAAAASYKSKNALEVAAVQGGGPPYRRVGRRALYRKADLLAWMERRTPASSAARHLEAEVAR